MAGHAMASGGSADDARMQQIVARASEHGAAWDGPQTGPRAQAGMTLAVVSEDLRNGGILGVAKGIKEAAGAIGWKIRVYDAGGTPEGRKRAMASARALQPDGVVLVGGDARAMQAELSPFVQQGRPVVGWHVAATAGTIADSPIAINVSTDPMAVARLTAMAAVVESAGHANVVIFTDSNFQIASAKAAAMAEVIRACTGCRLLAVEDVPISGSAQAMPAVMRGLLERYSRVWTHALAINDIYFDYAAAELTRAGKPDGIHMLSAGDGSAAAFLRIQAGAFQTSTVAEPLNLQGWQLVDEVNRLLAHQAVTGYVAPVHLVTAKNVAFDGGPLGQYDPDNGYRSVYRRIWGR
ncbi:substrate-binding domain-containing protein [Ralstonia sp. TCR112]|uniref:substrate-binding domain-containing protein n=1 Tax=Ralstonia TaxID=48736 RepID=UPI0011BF55C9|nr:substrate-binding domain-containing protein [Ralstonia sp. TCR112]